MKEFRIFSVRSLVGAIACVAFVAGGSQAEGVNVEIERDRAAIENGFLRWEMSHAQRRFRTTALVNRRTGRRLPIQGEDLLLELDDGTSRTGGELRIASVSQERVDSEGRCLVVEMSHGDVRLRIVTTMRPEQWWAERHVEIVKPPSNPTAVRLAQWRCGAARGPSGPGKVVGTLGCASGYGQPVYVDDFFLGIAHPGAENFVADGSLSCRIPVYLQSTKNPILKTRPLVVGAGEKGGARHAFLNYIEATRPVPARMIFLVNDWYWKNKDRPLEAMQALARVKQESGVPIDSFTLDDGWDFEWDEEAGIWGRLHRKRFPGGWNALQDAGRPAAINISLWFGPIGGYGYRERRLPFGRKMGYEINDDKFCLAGSRYRRHVIESFSRWASRGMDYIKVDGFWPNCPQNDHGHPVGPGSAIAQMDILMDVFATWRKAQPNLVIGYTSGSNPSPFWLQHADFVWRGGRDDSHRGTGEPFDRHNTFLDTCLQAHRNTEMPVSAFVTFDIVQQRIAGNSDEGFERGIWWLAARTSLHHDWYVQASDLTLEQWKKLARVSRWAMKHRNAFRFGRMIGGDPRKGETYGFSAFDGKSGTLALRNPSDTAATIRGSLLDLVDPPDAARASSFRLRHVFGAAQSAAGVRPVRLPLQFDLPPLGIAVFELETTAD